MGHRELLRGPTFPATVLEKPTKARERSRSDHGHRGNGQILSSLVTFVVAAGILYQGREARKARDDQDSPADHSTGGLCTGHFTTNIGVRNIGHGMAKNITFEFSAPLQSTQG